MSFGAEGETRTLAPVARPTPLAGAPRHQLEYFCIGSVYDTIRLLKERAENPLPLLSGGESGIRTHGALRHDGFQDRSVMTTSVPLRLCFDIIAYPGGPCQAKKVKKHRL